jgi:hypothetical protein
MKEETKETKQERFKRVATKRTNEVLEKIRILGNCANKSTYEFTEEEVNKIFTEIEKQLKMTKFKFFSERRERFKL